MSDAIGQGLKTWGEMRDVWSEQIFLGVYGSPVLQAMVGLRADPEVERAAGRARRRHRSLGSRAQGGS